MAKVNEFDKGLRAKTRPSNLDVRGQQRELFPFDAFEYQSPDESDSPFVRLKKPWVFGIDQSGIIGNSLDGNRRLLLEGGEITFQKWNPETLSWEDSSWVGSTIGGVLADYVHMRGHLHPDFDLSGVEIGFRPSEDAEIFRMEGSVEDQDGNDNWTTKTNLDYSTARKVHGDQSLKATSHPGTLERTAYPDVTWTQDFALAVWFWRAAVSDETEASWTVTFPADTAGSLHGKSFRFSYWHTVFSAEERMQLFLYDTGQGTDGLVADVGYIAWTVGIMPGDSGAVIAEKVMRSLNGSGMLITAYVEGAKLGVVNDDDTAVSATSDVDIGLTSIVNTGATLLYDTFPEVTRVTPTADTDGDLHGKVFTAERIRPDGSFEEVGVEMVADLPTMGVETAIVKEETFNRAFSRDGSMLAVCTRSDADGVRIYDTSDWSIIFQFTAGGASWGASWSPNDEYLALHCRFDPRLYILDTSDWSVVSGTPTFSVGTEGPFYSPDGSLLANCLASAGSVVDLVVHNTADWSSAFVDSGSVTNRRANEAAFSPDGAWLAVAYNQLPYLVVYDTSTWVAETIPAQPAGRGFYIDFSPDGNYLALSNTNGEPFVANVGTWDQVAPAGTFPTSGTFSLAFSPDGRYLALGLRAAPWIEFRKVGDWSVSLPAPTPPAADDVTGVAFSPSENLVVLFQTYSATIGVFKAGPTLTGYESIVGAVYPLNGSAAEVAAGMVASLAHPSWALEALPLMPDSMTWEDVETLFSAFNAFNDGWVPTEGDLSHDYDFSQAVTFENGGTEYAIYGARFTYISGGTCVGGSKDIDYKIEFYGSTGDVVFSWTGTASAPCVDQSWIAGPWDTTAMTFTGSGDVVCEEVSTEAALVQFTNTRDGDVTDAADVDTGFTIAKVHDGLANTPPEPRSFITLHDSSDTWTKEGQHSGTEDLVQSIAGMTKDRVACFGNITGGPGLLMREWDQATNEWSLVGSATTFLTYEGKDICRMTEARIAFFDGLTGELKTYDFDGVWTEIGNTLTIGEISAMLGGYDYRVTALTSTRIALAETRLGTLRVLEFDGTDWSLVGEVYTVPTGLGTNGFDMEALNESTVVIVQDATNEIRNYKFDGTTWSAEGTAVAPETTVNNPSIAVLSETEIVYGSINTKRAKGFSWDGDQWNFTFQGAEDTNADNGFMFTEMGPRRVLGVMYDTSGGPRFETWVRSSTVEVKHLYPLGLGLYVNGRRLLTEATVGDDWNLVWLPRTGDQGMVLWCNNSQSSDDHDMIGTQDLDVKVELDLSLYDIHIDELVLTLGSVIGQSTILDYYLGDLGWTTALDYKRDLLFAAADGGKIVFVSPVDLQGGKVYRPGEVIETISGVCNGQQVEGHNGIVTLPTVTGAFNPSTSYLDDPGSIVTYQPPPGTKTVIYRYGYYQGRDDIDSISHCKFFVGGVEAVHARGGTMSYDYATTRCMFEWPIRIVGSPNTDDGEVASWDTPLELKMQWRAHSTSRRIQLHFPSYWDGGGNPGHISFPTITLIALG